MRSAAALALVVVTACHYHRDTNAPGLVDLERPPSPPGRATMEYPGDPGERMVTVSSGALAGAGARARGVRTMFEVAAEVTVSLGESDRSHQDGVDRLFVPPGVLVPQRSVGLTLGWSVLQVVPRSAGEPAEISTGPLYLELQGARGLVGLAGGWAVDPTSGDHGPQINGFLGPSFLRMRYLVDGGFELQLGLQLKLPATWVWSR